VSDQTLTAAQLDSAKRAGETAALVVVSTSLPASLASIPKWVKACLRNVAEANAVGAGEATQNFSTTFTVGFSLGSLATLVSLLRKPEEKIHPAVVKAWMDHYFAAYFATVKNYMPFEIPQNFLGEFALQVVSVYIACSTEQRSEFQRGMAVSLSAEKNLRGDTPNDTTLTPIYFELLFYWREVTAMKSLPEVFKFLEQRFSDSPAVLGDFERFRKAANRLELSFRESQASPMNGQG